MESFLSAVLGELASRSINFFISRSSKPKVLEVEDRLKRALLRAQVIVNEATGRNITNQAMLQQLDMLRNAMHQGCYMLDTFRYQYHGVEDAKDHVVSHSLSPSKLSSLKGIGSFNRKTLLLEKLQEALDNLSFMILDVKELVVILLSYPRRYRQPYSMHFLLGNCMFGRQMESELVINFLLHTQRDGSKELEVLPIVGPCLVGKSTLVAHVCEDERIRDHFSEILFLHGHDFTGDDLAALREGRHAMEYQNHVNLNGDRRLLVVVELVGDLNKDAWNRLYSAMQHVPSGSKIIVTSRSDKITKLGTTQALRMKYLSCEAYWCFFKTLTFGSTDPEMHPRFAHLAMEIARMLNGCLIGANMTSCMLRDNFDIRFWCKVLAFLRGLMQKHVSRFGGHPFEVMNQNRPAHLRRMAAPSEDLVLYHLHQHPSQEEVPEIKILDVLYGSVKPRGKFDVLVWRSRIPPYYSYSNTCEIRELKVTGAKRKRV
ncbi:hypothetical protein SETIT_2G006800v2 [Setaria italica]|uniref:NB-ARC domain-containing protein n=1 Tax=Setaria italica TaxID=4555 RepID=K4A1F7_SETIT|nr:putative disease resistance protein At3g14460 [Setaria italica]RCV09183.1 hypothetical protein SETIT_2G006800v2 [Setaria italica]